MQRTNFTRFFILGLIGVIAVASVWSNFRQIAKKPVKTPVVSTKTPIESVQLPAFQADSAFYFVQKQVDFGPRVPNTPAHQKCAVWLAATFRRLGLTVIEQKFTAVNFRGISMNAVNIIGQYKPELPRRIVYAAHWDSRFMADYDPKKKDGAISGADDGGSGVAVLLEMSRLLQQQPADIGVDFVLFDAEDQGNDNPEAKNSSETWCLGAQHWAKNPHRPNYMPIFGILLDMVGGANPHFSKEPFSMQAAPGIVEMVWKTAESLGHKQAFVSEMGPAITDDHVFVIRDARIPMIDIVNRPTNTATSFVPHWHTHADNMSAIDKNTLRIVGETCTAVLYRVAANAI
jgi:glutaminyl-peptide cyclotransferase